MPSYFLLPLAGAIIYALGSIIVKRGLKDGVTMDQSFHLTNLVLAGMFLPLLFFERSQVDWSLIWKPLVMGATFFAGNWLTFLGIKRGDVSLVTPLMGTKVVFVALGVVLLTGQSPSVPLWVAAALTTLGIFVMGLADLKGGSHLAFTVLVTLSSAMIFGICDVLVSWWSADFGTPTFLAVGTSSVAFYTLIMWLLQGRPGIFPRKGVRRWAVGGAVMIGLQAIVMGVALSIFHNATGINVVYASRGLWVIILVVVFGSFLGNSEHRDNGRYFLWRVAGTVILTVAVIIAVMDRAPAATV